METLIGVVLGGIIAMAGQIAIDAQRKRVERASDSARLRAVCRLQQDSLWAYQNAIAHALRAGEWKAEFFDERYSIGVEDFRFIAERVPTEIWRPYSSAVRAQSEAVHLHSSDMATLLTSYCFAEMARQRLHAFSGLDIPTIHSAGLVQLTRRDIDAAVSDHYIGKSPEVKAVLKNLTPGK